MRHLEVRQLPSWKYIIISLQQQRSAFYCKLLFVNSVVCGDRSLAWIFFMLLSTDSAFFQI